MIQRKYKTRKIQWMDAPLYSGEILDRLASATAEEDEAAIERTLRPSLRPAARTGEYREERE